KIQEEVSQIRREITCKFLDANNLNFLIGTGASRYAGALAINKNDEPREYQKAIDQFSNERLDRKIKGIVASYKNLRIEEILDRLLTLKTYFDEFESGKNVQKKISELIYKIQKAFLEECVLNIDYSKNNFHKIFLKKLLSRKSSLNRVNLFTLNYDMLFEFAAEDMNILINNGFVGFQNRSFYPPAFKVDSYLRSKHSEQRFNKTFNLYKLHGSLSWEFNRVAAPYGISERQLKQNQNHQVTFDKLSGDNLIIYPVQNKKKRSLDLPYSELFRQFAESLSLSQSVLIVIGYSFLDEHVNDIIINALSNPDFNIVVFSYDLLSDIESTSFLGTLIQRAKEDSRITLFSGKNLGSFEKISSTLMPYIDEFDHVQESYRTFLQLKGEAKSEP
ncbi:MAG: hypothetical protein C0412_20450, partial [Flavobacterium sp.]|nr:hypothetical protein [Flavobacterium sp.]